MPALHAHDDDFLFQIQHPVELSLESPADAFLKCTVRRIRNGQRSSIYQVPSVGVSFWAKILQALRERWPLGR
jgi:hypothetical protein